MVFLISRHNNKLSLILQHSFLEVVFTSSRHFVRARKSAIELIYNLKEGERDVILLAEKFKPRARKKGESRARVEGTEGILHSHVLTPLVPHLHRVEKTRAIRLDGARKDFKCTSYIVFLRVSSSLQF